MTRAEFEVVEARMKALEKRVDRIDNGRLHAIEETLGDIRDWMHEQKGGRKTFIAMMGLSATIGALITRAFDVFFK